MDNVNSFVVQVLKDNPKFTFFEEVQDKCEELGKKVGLWAVYFAAKKEGRALKRKPDTLNEEQVIRELALSLIGLHGLSVQRAIETLKEVEVRNEGGERIPWELENTSPTETWELSVAQELIDECGAVDRAIDSVMLR